eukprot:scaffold7747_cov363-Prasinococcus_capsulatus_cf.AAC.3
MNRWELPKYRSPTDISAAAWTCGDSSSSGNEGGCRAGMCKNSIFDTVASMVPLRAAAMPKSTPTVVASCSCDRYRYTSVELSTDKWPCKPNAISIPAWE